jgi:hypothetical protein
MLRELDLEIAELLNKAEEADSMPLKDGLPVSSGDSSPQGTQNPS